MQFRKIFESMTDHEAEALLHILLPGSNMKELNLQNKGIYQIYMLANGYSEYLKEDAEIQDEVWRDWIEKAQKNIHMLYCNKNVKSAEVLTDLENLAVNYRNLQGLIETFGAGA